MKHQKTTARSTSLDEATDYAKSVVAGKTVAGRLVIDACKRHLSDLSGAKSRNLYWDPAAAQHAIGFFRDILCLNGGQFEGKPFNPKPWQCFILGSLFGWKRADGTRRFRTAYIETAKGSGKSPLAAGIGLLLLVADNEPRAEIYAAAVKQDQAKVLFRDATAMVNFSPKLGSRLTLTGGADPDNIAYIKAGSFFRPISSERQGRGQSGPRPHGALLDEIHEHPTNAIVEFMSAGVKWRRQPLIIMITNSGSDRQTVCWEYHAYSEQICSGILENDSFFGYVCSLDKGDDPFKDESCWIKANPSLPEIPGYDYIREEVRKAKGMPSKEALCRRLNFCEWTDAADSWLTKDVWASVQHHLDINDYTGKECYGGLDLSINNDLTALTLAFPTGHRQWDCFTWFWMPGEKLLEIESKLNMAPRFQQWRDDGYVHATPSKTIDFEHAAHFISDLCSRFNVLSIGYDRAKIDYFLAAAERIGLNDLPLQPHGQGFYKAQDTGLWMPGSIDEAEAAIVDKRIRVNENPMLTWNVASAVLQPSTIEPSQRYFTKRKSSGKIDGAVSFVMAIGTAASGGVSQKTPQLFFF